MRNLRRQCKNVHRCHRQIRWTILDGRSQPNRSSHGAGQQHHRRCKHRGGAVCRNCEIHRPRTRRKLSHRVIGWDLCSRKERQRKPARKRAGMWLSQRDGKRELLCGIGSGGKTRRRQGCQLWRYHYGKIRRADHSSRVRNRDGNVLRFGCCRCALQQSSGRQR